MALILVALATGCGGSAPPGDAGADVACTFVDPSCEMPAPSYKAVLEAVVVQTCTSCHYPHSPKAQTSLTSYDDIHGELGAALDQVSNCLMPPAGYPQPTSAERQALLTWLACGAPDN